MATVKKAIIPAAGLGTRLLPATKAQPKEMLPIVDKPAIQYIVEEAVASGITDIIIVTGRGKRAIEDHFDKSYELEEVLEKKNKTVWLKEVQSISKLANIFYIRQGEAKGLGHAIACAKHFVGEEPFAVLLGDDIIRSEVPAIQQLIRIYQTYESSVVGVQSIPLTDAQKYGMIAPSKTLEQGVYQLASLIEKPGMDQSPSNLAIMGRYILTPDIFTLLEKQTPGAGGEIQLTDAINQLAQSKQVLANEFVGRRFDIGSKLNLIKANIELALERDDLRTDLLSYIKDLAMRHMK